jgi:hypothetical protein
MITFPNKNILEKVKEKKSIALITKWYEIDKLLKPYNVITDEKILVYVPNNNEEIRIKYNKLVEEYNEIINEINLMDKN